MIARSLRVCPEADLVLGDAALLRAPEKPLSPGAVLQILVVVRVAPQDHVEILHGKAAALIRRLAEPLQPRRVIGGLVHACPLADIKGVAREAVTPGGALMEEADIFVALVVPGALLNHQEALRVPVVRLGAAVTCREAEPPEGALRRLTVKRAEEVGGEGAPDEVLRPCHKRGEPGVACVRLFEIKGLRGLLLPPEALERAPCGRLHLALGRSRRSPVLEHPVALVDDSGVGLMKGSHHPLKYKLREIKRGVRRAVSRGLPEKRESLVLLPLTEEHPAEAPGCVGVAPGGQSAPGLPELLLPIAGSAPWSRLLHHRADKKSRGLPPELIRPAFLIKVLCPCCAHIFRTAHFCCQAFFLTGLKESAPDDSARQISAAALYQ